MGGLAQRERRALTELLSEVGPDAPTLCEGWTARDLAAHLVVRERRPDAALGIVAPFLAGYTTRVQRHVRDRQSWTGLVDEVRDGPPAFLRPLDETVNTVEYFVHHEDVRRAAPTWAPRVLDRALEETLWARVKLLGRLAARKLSTGLVLDAPSYGRASVRRGHPEVVLRGAPGELLLFLTGRQQAARVDLEGPPEAVAAVRAAKFGL